MAALDDELAAQAVTEIPDDLLEGGSKASRGMGWTGRIRWAGTLRRSTVDTDRLASPGDRLLLVLPKEPGGSRARTGSGTGTTAPIGPGRPGCRCSAPWVTGSPPGSRWR